MIKDRLQEYIAHPVFISLIVWGILTALIPPLFSKYRIKHIRDEFASPKEWNYFSDIDNDGRSEKISLDLNDTVQTKIIVSKNDKIIEQYNLKYQPPFDYVIYAGDYNSDFYKELYIFTMNRDSIFLNVIDPVLSQKVIINQRFIDFRRRAAQSVDAPHIVTVDMINSRDKNSKDLIFFISAGFSKQPRNVYRYIIAEDSLVRSPQSGASILKCLINDINNDSLPEFILDVSAHDNIHEEFPYSDQYSWLMVLDNKLQFLFPPLKLLEYPSRVTTIPMKMKNRTCLIVFNTYYGIGSIPSFFYLFDPTGNKITEKPVNDFENINNNIFINNDQTRSTFYFLKNRYTRIMEIDSNFQELKTITIPRIESAEPVAQLDADLDGEREYAFQGSLYKSLIITRYNFLNPVSFYYNQANGLTRISQLITAEGKPQLYLQFADYSSYIQYGRNPLFLFKYPFYAVLYLAVMLFIFLISRIQRYRLSLKLQTEKRIASIQMKAIKNQIDPHFTLNILNAIGSLYASGENRKDADYIFGKYARLIRQTVISSEQIIITFADELDFVRNYIDLERFRCDNAFDYNIEIGSDVELQIKIPRMLIYTFVENAIKYGIRSKTENGLLKIIISREDNNYNVIVEDNGPGLESQQTTIKGTGRGLLILNELIELYYKLEKVKINYTLQNITGENNTVSGTRAVIKIPRGNPRS